VFSDGPSHPVKYEELLSYARRISKTTLPPPGITNGVLMTGGDVGMIDLNTSMNGGQTQASSTAPTPSQSQVQSPAANGSQLLSELPSQQTIASTNTSLPPGLSNHLDPTYGMSFFPWPLETKIRSGSLASNQLLMEQGIDPKGYDPALEEVKKRQAEEERKEQELRHAEEERKAHEEKVRRQMERDRQREKEQMEGWRRGSVITGAAGAPGGVPRSATAGPGEKKQFKFSSMMDDDDDDD
jgi:hypothetical protein